jgi:rod shape-determining protein MreC
MTWFMTIFRKNRQFFSVGLVIVLFASIAISPDRIRPLLGNVSSILFLRPFFEMKAYVLELQHVGEENRRLRSTVAEFALQLSALSEAKRENERLREFLGFDPPENFRVVPVKIVSLTQNIYPVAALINKGRKDSVSIDQPVINRFGLVGKVTEIMPDFATVALLTDPSNAVSGRLAESRQIGIVRFSPKEGMYLDNLPADADAEPGDLVITSGLGGIYPAGLSVAIVDSALARKGEILKKAWLKPMVDFFEIDELYVLVSETK